MTFIKEYSGVVALVILAILGLSNWFGGSKTLFGSTACSGITCLSGGLRLVSDAGGDFESDVSAAFASTATFASTMTVAATTTDAGNIVITTSNAATSSIQVGCVQTVATSTLTPIQLSFEVANNATTTYSGTSNGFVAWKFGKCPRN